MDNSHCLSGLGFSTLTEAKYACSNTNNCVGILDEDCKDDFEYYLCLDFYSKDKELSSCIYKKKEGRGIWHCYMYNYFNAIPIF